MEAFWSSLLLIGLAELGDKTQLLTFVLVRQFRRPLIIAIALGLAFLVSYSLAAIVGVWIEQSFIKNWIHWASALMFLAIGCWILLSASDSHNEPEENTSSSAKSSSITAAFAFSFVSILTAELGDKSQLSLVAISIHLQPIELIVAGALLGTLIVNLPVLVLARHSYSRHWLQRSHQEWIGYLAGSLFIVFGLVLLLS